MRRPPVHEWAVLGEDADPVPGDPDAVAALGGLLRDTADEIWRESGEVRALASVESWKSDAAERFRNAADDAVGNLRKAYHRYDVAARAMGTSVQEGSDGNWASALEQAQKMAAKALRDAQTADADHRAATEKIRGLPTDTLPTDPSAVSLRARQDDAASALTRAKGELQAAKDLHDRAARHAADRIHRAITHDGLHDSTWDKVGSDIGTALSDTGDFLKDVGETTVNDLASLGNSIIHNGPALASFTLGLGGMIIGGGGEVLGVALDATGGGAILGVPINVACAGLFTAGAAGVLAGGASMISDAAGPDRVNMFSDSGGGGGGDWEEEQGNAANFDPEDFENTEYSLDEVASMTHRHTGSGDMHIGGSAPRPSEAEIADTLKYGKASPLAGQNAVQYVRNGIRVIVNKDMPWQSTSYYIGK